MAMSREEMVGAIDDLFREIFGKYLRPKQMPPHPDVTMAQMHCLAAIGELGRPTMSELSEELGLHPSSVTALVDALVEQGLVEREGDPDDRRVVRVTHTAEGRRQRLRHLREQRERLKGLLGETSDEDLVRILEALTTLRDAAEGAVRARGGGSKGSRTGSHD